MNCITLLTETPDGAYPIGFLRGKKDLTEFIDHWIETAREPAPVV